MSAVPPTDAAPAVRVAHVTKVFGEGPGAVTALDDVSLDVARGSIQGVIGYSGAGKSTLARLVNGLESPTDGQVEVGGQSIVDARGRGRRALTKTTAMVFQHFNLLDTLTIRANVEMPLSLDGTGRRSRPDVRERTARVAEALDFVGLADRADAYPGELSGGQKQRVGIARALVRRPDVLLCDEATSALDPATTRQIVDLLRRVNAEFGTSMLVVTHEMDVIKDLCDHVAVMEDGHIVESGAVLDVFTAPRRPTTQRFVDTIVPRTPPASLDTGAPGRTGPIWRLVYTGDSAGRPMLSTLARDLGLEVNILAATITEIHAQTVGYMVVRVTGDPATLSRGRAELEHSGVLVEDASDTTEATR